MKKCPFCAEEIQDEAIKCRFCNEFLDGQLRAPAKEGGPWYFKTSIIILAMLTVGPLALPMVWLNPKYSTTKKIVITAVVLLITYLLSIAMGKAMQGLQEYYKMISSGQI